MKNPFMFDAGDPAHFTDYYHLCRDILTQGRAPDCDIPLLPLPPEIDGEGLFTAFLERQDAILLLWDDILERHTGIICLEGHAVSLWLLDRDHQGHDLGKHMFFHLLNHIYYVQTRIPALLVTAAPSDRELLESWGLILREAGPEHSLYHYPLTQ